jgi:hypothetical protein
VNSVCGRGEKAVAHSCAAGQRALSSSKKRGVSQDSARRPFTAPARRYLPTPAHVPLLMLMLKLSAEAVRAQMPRADHTTQIKFFVIMQFHFEGGVPVLSARARRLRAAACPPPPTYAFSCLCSDCWLQGHVSACAVGSTGAIGKIEKEKKRFGHKNGHLLREGPYTRVKKQGPKNQPARHCTETPVTPHRRTNTHQAPPQ